MAQLEGPDPSNPSRAHVLRRRPAAESNELIEHNEHRQRLQQKRLAAGQASLDEYRTEAEATTNPTDMIIRWRQYEAAARREIQKQRGRAETWRLITIACLILLIMILFSR